MKTETTSDDALFMVTRSYPNASREYEQHKNLNLVHLEIEMADKSLFDTDRIQAVIDKLNEKFTSNQVQTVVPIFVGDNIVIPRYILRQMSIDDLKGDTFEVIEIVSSNVVKAKRKIDGNVSYYFPLSEIAAIHRK